MINKKYDPGDGEFRIVRLISGVYKSLSVGCLVGYCHCDAHRGFIDTQLYKKHQCLEKECPFLEAYSEYPYWKNREKQEYLKNERKKYIKQKKEKQERYENRVAAECERKLKMAKLIAYELKYPITVVRVAPVKRTDRRYQYIVNYVSDYPFDDWRDYFDLVKIMSARIGGRYLLRRLKLPDGRLAFIKDLKESK